MNPLLAYIAPDRRAALAQGEALPDRVQGAALFADISGFTPLTEAFARALGARRGAEELTRLLNRVYEALIAQVDRFGGSVVGFSGDAISCWFDGDDGPRAVASGLAMQDAMAAFAAVPVPQGGTLALTLKVAVAAGAARRFAVGDPTLHLVDVLAGATLDRLAEAEHQARAGEVVVDAATVAQPGEALTLDAWRGTAAVVEAVPQPVEAMSLPDLRDGLSEAQARPWLLPAVYERLRAGQGTFLTELRPAVALFMGFGGLDYDAAEAGAQLDQTIRWVQAVVARYDGALLQVTIGDKGSYLYAAFGAPIAHADDATRAEFLRAAQELRAPPDELAFLKGVRIGISRGRMRYEESLTLHREGGDMTDVTISLNNLGNVAYSQGDFDIAEARYQESLVLQQQIGYPYGLELSMLNLGLVAWSQGNYAMAQQRLEACLAQCQTAGSKDHSATALHYLGLVAWSQGDYPTARTRHAESRALRWAIGHKAGIAASLAGVAAVDVALPPSSTGQAARAARLIGVAQTLIEAVGARLEVEEQLLYDAAVSRARATLDEDAFAAAWAEGQAMALDAAVAYALADHEDGKP